LVVRSTAAAWPLTQATRSLGALTAWSNAAVPLACGSRTGAVAATGTSLRRPGRQASPATTIK
jgi:hypothetical protein